MRNFNLVYMYFVKGREGKGREWGGGKIEITLLSGLLEKTGQFDYYILFKIFHLSILWNLKKMSFKRGRR